MIHFFSNEKKRLFVKTRSGNFITLLMCILLIPISVQTPAFALTTTQAQSAGTQTAPVFSTPEDAVQHFCKALAECDLQSALQACAVREQAQGFDFPGLVDMMQMNNPIQNIAPTTSEFYTDLNSAAILGSFASQIKMLVYSFFLTDGMDGKPIVPADKEYAKAFEQAADTAKLSGLKLLRIDPPTKSVLESDRNIRNFTKMAKIYGAEEMTERIVLYELNGETFLGGFGLYRYASGWMICRLYSNLAGLPSTGAAEPISLQAYLGML